MSDSFGPGSHCFPLHAQHSGVLTVKGAFDFSGAEKTVFLDRERCAAPKLAQRFPGANDTMSKHDLPNARAMPIPRLAK
jgi:hypothetical protein